MTEARLAQSPDVLVQELDGQFLLLKTGSSDVVHLDAVASDIWRVLLAVPTVEELAEELARAYAVSVTQVTADLLPALEVLRSRGLLLDRQ